jgi:type VI protein secretion system component Hcp
LPLKDVATDNGLEEEASESVHNEDIEFAHLDDKSSPLIAASSANSKRRFRIGMSSSNNYKQHPSPLSKDPADLLLISTKGA